MPGSMPATSQLDWLISMTAMIVLFWSRATRDLLKSFGWGIAGTPSGTADDARLLADLYTHNASRQMPQKGSSDQAVACLRRLGAGVVGSAAVCAFRFRPPGTGSKRAGWRRSGAIFAFFAAVCFEPGASRARLPSGHSISWLQRRWCHFLAACPIPSLSWRGESGTNSSRAAGPTPPIKGRFHRRSDEFLESIKKGVETP